MVAEQFGTVVDDAVAVEINGEQTVFGGHPAGALGKAVVVQIKPDAAVGKRRSPHAVAVEIKDDGGINTGSLCCVGSVRVSRQGILAGAVVAGDGFDNRFWLIALVEFPAVAVKKGCACGDGAFIEIGNGFGTAKLFVS